MENLEKWHVSFTDESGNYSMSSNASDTCGSSQETDANEAALPTKSILKEKDQALFLALQDVRKLRSELERLKKSEEWYKKELHTQKNTRLDALERLYTQERKYMQENQRLQRECVRLYEKCADLEKEVELRKHNAMQKLSQECNTLAECTTMRSKALKDFELEQQNSIIKDQQKLIEILRKQKRDLLEDLKQLTLERDENLLRMQQDIASIDGENMRMTAKCKQLLEERNTLRQELELKSINFELEIAEKLKLQCLVDDLKEQIDSIKELLAEKEQLSAAETCQCNSNQNKISAKSTEMILLKAKLQQLQNELSSINDVQKTNADQEQKMEQLNFTLESQQTELQILKNSDVNRLEQINELQFHLERMINEQQSSSNKLHAAQTTLKSKESELLALSEQYASMCALCERTKFELEMLQINERKTKFEAENDRQEIRQLKEKLNEYLEQAAVLSNRIMELEDELLSKRDVERVLADVRKENDNYREAHKSKAAKQNVYTQADFEALEQSVFDDIYNSIYMDTELEEHKNFIANHSNNSSNNLTTLTAVLKSLLLDNQKLKTQLTDNSVEQSAECKVLKEKDIEMLEDSIMVRDYDNDKAAQKLMQNKDVQTDEISFYEAEQQVCESEELRLLRAKLLALETELRASVSLDHAKSEKRMQFLKDLLEQQTSKVDKLKQTQVEWEEMLVALNKAQKQEEQTRQALQTKANELEQLTELFEQQNDELRQLQAISLHTEQQHYKDKRNRIIELEQNIAEKLNENNELKAIISALKNDLEILRKNNEFNEIEKFTEKLETVQIELRNVSKERDAYNEELQQLKNSVFELQRNKREAIIMPDNACCLEDAACDMENNANDSHNVVITPQAIDDDDRLRILTKVLEAEYQRKMKRYDVHIHTLLSNVKGLKKSLKTAEQNAARLGKDQAKTTQDLRDFQKTKISLDELRFKFEQSQSTIKALEQSLLMERKKFEACDMGKIAQQETAHELPNLIDDYKKLIQQSAIATRRQKTSAILNLIERSNQCVPNLNRLESSVDGLRIDLEYFLDRYAQSIDESAELKMVPSLMDELRVAQF